MSRHPLDAIVDRPRREAALAVAAAWLAFMAGLMAGGEVADAGSFAFAAASGLVVVFLGFAAAARCRPRPRNLPAHRGLFLWSLVLGAGLGLANLAANLLIARADPALRVLLIQRMAALDPLEGVVASPIVEEVVIRLFLMSAMAWVVSRFTKRARLVLAVALVGSALVFALLHLARPLPTELRLANYYRAALLIKYTLAGVPLGWIFWRWGLPYAILSHAAANAPHLAFQKGVF